MLNLKWYESNSSVRPDELDTEMSPTTVYFRRNIQEIQVTPNEEEGEDFEPYTTYRYEEAICSKEEYREHLRDLETQAKEIDLKQQRADIDYIALMTGVDLEV